jgi:hypothetical protein
MLEQKHKQAVAAADAAISRHVELLVQQDRQIFRYYTFGDQDYRGLLGLHQAIEGASLGGVIERMIQPDDKPLTALASIVAALPESYTPAPPSQKTRLDCDRGPDFFLDELLGANKTPSFRLASGTLRNSPRSLCKRNGLGV